MNRIFCDSTLDPKGVCDEFGITQPSSSSKKEKVIAQLYQAHRQDILLQLLSMVKDRSIAEELLQDTFVRLSKMPGIEVIRQPRPFLMKIANNLALDYLRQLKKRPEIETEEACAELIDPLPEHMDLILKERRLKQLKHAINQLPSRAREALMLAKFREMTLKEVAKEMDISQTMVEKHLKTALQKCRIALTSETH